MVFNPDSAELHSVPTIKNQISIKLCRLRDKKIINDYD